LSATFVIERLAHLLDLRLEPRRLAMDLLGLPASTSYDVPAADAARHNSE
jgi:hypothetical protein